MSKIAIKNTSSQASEKCTYKQLQWYLKHKHSLSLEEKEKYKDLIDNSKECWEIWNRVRWDAAMEDGGLDELKDYFGSNFVPYYDSSWHLAKRWNKESPRTKEEIEDFYKSADEYVYNLMIWYESEDRIDLRKDIIKLIDVYEIKSVVDYGCGVGNDGLFFLKNNLKTNFVDFDCPATRFLKWRLNKRNIEENFYQVDKIHILPKADLFWAIDVLEHMVDPTAVVDKLSQECKVFVHRSKFNDTAGGRHPCHINFEQQELNESLRKSGFKKIDWENISVWTRGV